MRVTAFLSVAALGACGVLGACSSTRLASSPEALPATALANESLGVVVLSTHAPGPCRMTAMWAHVHEAASGRLVDDAPLVPIDIAEGSDFTDGYGQLSALPLRPGRYYLSATYTQAALATKAGSEFFFEVLPGHVSYIGALTKTSACAEATAFRLQDDYARDMPAALAKWPALVHRPVDRALLKIGGEALYTR